MPSVKLTDDECSHDLLPKICMFCGQPATTRKQRNFAWHPQWVWVLILAGLLIALIVALVLTKRMTVRVPVCDEHEGFWRRKGMALGFSFLGLCLVAMGVLVFMVNQGPGNDDVTGWACLGSVGLFLAWLVFAAIYGSRGIRPTEITDRYVRLTGVADEFVEALEDDRERDREEEAERRRVRRLKREADDRARSEGELPPKLKPIRDDDDLERRSRE